MRSVIGWMFLGVSGALCAQGDPGDSSLQAAESRPSIIVILADDLGYADVGVHGCTDIPTPHIDSIAKNGVRFTNGYANHHICSPSRAGLMTGMYQHRFGFEHNSGPEQYASARFGVPRSVPMLSEKLKEVGYATSMVGKWHIGFKEGLRPHERGFDQTYVFHSGARTYYPEGRRNNNPMWRNGKEFKDEKEYLTDAFARDSVAFIENSKEQPFFLYLSFNAVHAPLEATPAYEERFSEIKSPDRKTYAGMLSAMDDAVGRVLGKLRELALEEKTLVFFYSDNGGPTSQTTSRNDPFRGFKGQFFEGGIRIPFMVQWKGEIPAGEVYHQPVMGFDVHATALAAAGIAVPEGEWVDGEDLLPFLTGERSGKPHEQLFWRAGQSHAARVGDWKLIRERGQLPMLFDLGNDIGERTDLASQNPEKMKELQVAYEAWAGQMKPARWIRQDARNAKVGGERKAVTTVRRAGTRIEQAFKKMDKDKDGKITPEEAPKKVLFDEADANKNGKITLRELRDYYRRRR